MKLTLEADNLKGMATKVRELHELFEAVSDQSTNQAIGETLFDMLGVWMDAYDADVRIVPRHPAKPGRPGYTTIADVVRKPKSRLRKKELAK
jgi:hypothetical protein